MDHQLRPVVILRPVIAVRSDPAVVGGRREVEERPVKDDRPVGPQGLQKLVHSSDRDLAARGQVEGSGGRHGRQHVVRVNVAQRHLSEQRGLQCLAAHIRGIDPAAAAVPAAAHIVAFKDAAVHGDAVALEVKNAGGKGAAAQFVGEEEDAPRVITVQHDLGAVVVDAVFMDRDSFAVVHVEEEHGVPLACAGAVVVDVAVLHRHIAAGADGHRAVAAFVNLGGFDRDTVAFPCLNADGAAAVEAAVFNAHVVRHFKKQNAAHAPAGFCRVPGGEIFKRHVPAIADFQDVRVPRDGGQNGTPLPRAADRQILHVMQIQLKAVIGLVPAVIRTVGILAVV